MLLLLVLLQTCADLLLSLRFDDKKLHAVLQALVSRLQKDILPKIENQISELAKQDEPNEVTQTITQQLKVGHCSCLSVFHLYFASCYTSHLLRCPNFGNVVRTADIASVLSC